MKGILGRKVGMTQLFTSEGKLIPVTVVEVKPNVVTKVLTSEKNGYVALQLATEDKNLQESLNLKLITLNKQIQHLSAS